jgi:hypothetical protein
MINIHISTRKCEYNIDLTQRITIVFGESSTGKSALFRLVQTFFDVPNVLKCSYNCFPLVYNPHSLDILRDTLAIKEQVVFIDEDDSALRDCKILELLANSQSYLVIITRCVKGLVFGWNNIFKMSSIKGYHYLEPYFNFNVSSYRIPSVVIVEGPNIAYEFFKALFSLKGINVIRSNGKADLPHLIKHYSDSHNVLAIFYDYGIGDVLLANHKCFTCPRVQCFAADSLEYANFPFLLNAEI